MSFVVCASKRLAEVQVVCDVDRMVVSSAAHVIKEANSTATCV